MPDPLRRIDALVEETPSPRPGSGELRLAAGLTQTEVADAIGVSRLHGGRRVSPSLTEGIAARTPISSVGWPRSNRRPRLRRRQMRDYLAVPAAFGFADAAFGFEGVGMT